MPRAKAIQENVAVSAPKKSSKKAKENVEIENVTAVPVQKRNPKKTRRVFTPLEGAPEDPTLALCDKVNVMSIKEKPKRSVNFGGEEKASEEFQEFNGEDAPAWVGIDGAFGSKSYSQEDREEEEKRQERRGKVAEEPVRVEEKVVVQSFTIHDVFQEMNQEMDTKTMSIQQLRSALELRNRSTAGTREELTRRLEKLLLKEGGQPSPGMIAASKRKLDFDVKAVFNELDNEVYDPTRCFVETEPVAPATVPFFLQQKATSTPLRSYSKRANLRVV
eukprot:TRINITY_DN7467_c0_g1_i2.p1 TRINITY_DN7467_c0_g1~~TRINITY_DN7467_c0_g1_i2.p1  ORF type:complete len:276 (+),score=126.40 TRINITY_DN7467_c0_g1_i2:28-855(+)